MSGGRKSVVSIYGWECSADQYTRSDEKIKSLYEGPEPEE